MLAFLLIRAGGAMLLWLLLWLVPYIILLALLAAGPLGDRWDAASWKRPRERKKRPAARFWARRARRAGAREENMPGNAPGALEHSNTGPGER